MSRKRSGSKNQHVPYRHIIRKFVRNGREYHFHATKGWRSRSYKL